MITFLSLFVFVLVIYLSFLLHLLTYETLWFGTTLFFLIVIIHVQVCWQISGEVQQNKFNTLVIWAFWFSYLNGYSLCFHSWQIVVSKIISNMCMLHIFRVFQLYVWSASLQCDLQQRTSISRDFCLRFSKRLEDSDLVIIRLTGIGPIRRISVLDWFLSYCLNENCCIVLTNLAKWRLINQKINQLNF